MYLSKLEIFGFKSFPEKTTLELSSGVSAIVGPNGSGKSNIVDALRWVLGEQGDKALRSERREDVVFSGTSKRKPLSVAEVALTIINNKNILPTEFSEVQIARRFFRSGETEYYLNGTKVRLKDIKNLFVDTGIGADAYSVIELKMVETILSHVKNERRKMFEEAAGIVSYKQNRELTKKKLESVAETLLRVNDIIREKMRTVSALERQAKKNEEAKIVFNDLKLLEIIYYTYEYNRLINEIKQIQDHEQENIDLESNLKIQTEKEEAEFDKLQPDIKTLESEKDNYDNDIENIRDKINQLEKDNLVISEQIKNLNNKIKWLTEENEKNSYNLATNIDRCEELEKNINVLKRTLEITEVSLTEKKNNVDLSIHKLTEKKNDIADIGLRLKESNNLINSSKSEYGSNKIIIDKNIERMKIISDNNENELNEITRLEKEKNDFDTQLDSLVTIKKLSQTKYRDALERKNKFKAEQEDLKKEETDLTINLKNKENKITYLQNLIETMEDFAEGISFLKKDSRFNFIDTIMDTIETDEKYRIALETALGEISTYLIVSDSLHLDKLINALKENDKGKVTFILMDSLKEQLSSPFYFDTDYYSPDILKEKGVLGFADKFVKCINKDYEILIKYILDEYIIVDNTETAFRHSKDNYYKFITLDGDIITGSVVRSGGNTKEENLKFGREKQIEKLLGETESLKNQLDEIHIKIEDCITQINAIDEETLKQEYDEKEREISNIKNKITLHEFKINELNKKVASNDIVYNNLKEDNKRLNERVNELINDISKLENNQNNLDKELDFITTEFNEIEQTHSLNLSDYNSYLIEFNRLKNELKNEESSLTRINNTREIQEKSIKRNTIQISELESEIGTHNQRLEDNKNALSNFINERKILQSRLDELNIKLGGKKDEKERLESSMRISRNNLQRVSKLLVDSKISMKQYEIRAEQHRENIEKKYEISIENIPSELFEGLQMMKEKYSTDSMGFNNELAYKDIQDLSEKLKKLGGGFQQIIWEDFEKEKSEMEQMIAQRNDLHESEKAIKKTIDRINEEAKERFHKTFEQIRQNFINIFKELFQEGDEANLKLVFEEDDDGKINTDPLEAKIEITAKPRGKRPTSIELLSGGEKTLTAIALLFAIYLVKPSPFCVLDEVDAPLDVANLGRFNRMIRKFSANTQFILITHNERTMETVDTLYGVTMQEPGVTTIVETRFKEVEKN